MHRRAFLRRSAALAGGLALAGRARAQDDDRDRMPPGFDQPDERGEVWAQVEYQGTTAVCPIPRALRQRNTGGSDGAGLCVIASQVTDGRYQRLTAAVEAMWAEAKQRPGGYYPSKLKALMGEVAPDVPYKSYEGNDLDWMPAVLAQGIPIGVTYGTGRGYQYQRIAHMVSLIHLDQRLAGIIDNNFPGFVAWMPRPEFARRFSLGSAFGWAFYLDVPGRRPRRPSPSPTLPGHGVLGFGVVALSGLTGLGLGALAAAALLQDPEPRS